MIAAFRRDIEAAGVGAPTVRKTLVTLQSMLRSAVEWQRLAANPVQATRKPSVKRQRAVRPLAPAAVEQLRAWAARAPRHPRRDARECPRVRGRPAGGGARVALAVDR